MFTGIIEKTARIVDKSDASAQILTLTIAVDGLIKQITLGDSLAVNGVCLTVTETKDDTFKADVSLETKKCTTLADLAINTVVNLERAMTLEQGLNGHLVTGHVDGVAKVVSIDASSSHDRYQIAIELPDSISCFVVNKGSITIDGVSLTVNQILANQILVNIVPYTLENTQLKKLNVADFVNVEADIMAKYVGQYLDKLKNN